MLSSLNPLPVLPEYAGPYKVGSTEFEIPVSEISSSSTVPDTDITTVKFRVCYPTTADAKAGRSVHWLPAPQKRWVDAYSSFMTSGFPRLHLVASSLLAFLKYTVLPVVAEAPLLPRRKASSYPLAFFSHGLGGNSHTYSSVVGSLASCGVICVAPEHRDGSAPIAIIRSARDDILREIPYRKYAHAPTTEVINARNTQLRVRLWELELIYSAITDINKGKHFTNYASPPQGQTLPDFQNAIDLGPGRVTWAGHSFGAATVTQLVKSVYYHQELPTAREDPEERGWDWTPLYTTAAGSGLVKQIQPESPVALLDLWTMPLRGEVTSWLWERPLPCYNRTDAGSPNDAKPNVVAVMSAEFHQWSDMLSRTRALLSRSPVAGTNRLGQSSSRGGSESYVTPVPVPPLPEISKKELDSTDEDGDRRAELRRSGRSSRSDSPLSGNSGTSGQVSAASSQSSLGVPVSDADVAASGSKRADGVEPHLYYVQQSAHLSQSDFGLLFPNAVKYMMKVVGPEKIMDLNVRAILAAMRGGHIDVAALKGTDQTDRILEDGYDKEERWVRLPLS